MRRWTAVYLVIGIAVVLLLAYGGVYVYYRKRLDFVHRVSENPATHVVESNPELHYYNFKASMLSGDPDWRMIERKERSWQSVEAFFLPLRWLECRWWDVFYPKPKP